MFPRVMVTALSVTLLASAGVPASAQATGAPARAVVAMRAAGAAPVLRTATASAPLPAFRRWRGSRLANGRLVHTVSDGGVRIGTRPDRVAYDDPYGVGGAVAYDRGRWFSPWVRPGAGFVQLVASYTARTPVGTFIEISARARTSGGSISSWDSLGRWASHDRGFHRMSRTDQPDDVAWVDVDTLVAQPGLRLTRWQLRVSLLRRTGSGRTPVLTSVGAVASAAPSARTTSSPGTAAGTVLAVPRYSQEIHAGEYPQYNGGGEAWCSPTSTTMVLSYWNRGPTPRQYSWVNSSYTDPEVDYAARYTFAWGYDGTGMWPFNTAYAARFGVDGFVTRLRSLRQAELFIRAGIPLVASVSFGRGELDGAPISSTAGHLLVIRGFTDTGAVVVNDPAAPTNRTVRRVYKRGQFENAWSDKGGVVYVIRPASVPLPAPARHPNW